MKKVSKVAVLAVALSALTHSSWLVAGQETHGGNAVVCEGKSPVLLDFYHASLPTLGHGFPKLVDLKGKSADQVVALIRGRLSSPLTQSLFDDALRVNGPVGDWISTDLRRMDDSVEPYVLNPSCKRVTAAIRQGDVMYVDPGVYGSLAPEQQGLLLVHEALYRMSGQDTSENIRNVMRTILRESFSREELIASVHLIAPFYYWEKIAGPYTPEGFKDRTCLYEFATVYGLAPGSSGTFKGVNFLGIPATGCPEVGQAGVLCSATSDRCDFRVGGCVLNTSDPAKLVLSCPDGSRTVLVPQI